ncbi:MAG: LapA family protein [Calditrichia bacterium]
MKPKGIIILILIVLLLIVLFQNLVNTDIHLLFWVVKIPLLLIMFVPFLIGIITGLLLRTGSRKEKKIAKEPSHSPKV